MVDLTMIQLPTMAAFLLVLLMHTKHSVEIAASGQCVSLGLDYRIVQESNKNDGGDQPATLGDCVPAPGLTPAKSKQRYAY